MDNLQLILSYYSVEQVLEIIDAYFESKLKKTAEQVRYFFGISGILGEHYTKETASSPLKIKPEGVKYYINYLNVEFNKLNKEKNNG